MDDEFTVFLDEKVSEKDGTEHSTKFSKSSGDGEAA